MVRPGVHEAKRSERRAKGKNRKDLRNLRFLCSSAFQRCLSTGEDRWWVYQGPARMGTGKQDQGCSVRKKREGKGNGGVFPPFWRLLSLPIGNQLGIDMPRRPLLRLRQPFSLNSGRPLSPADTVVRT